MTAKEVDKLAKQVGLSVPPPLRAYLMEVGLFQDLTWGASDIEVYDDSSDFVLNRNFLSQMLPAKDAELFPFGDDGAGNIFCLPTADSGSCRIHFFDHETAKVAKQKEFSAWLQSVVAKVLRGIRRRPRNDRKAWCVQFTFANMSYEELAKLLSSVGRVKPIDKKWMNPDTSAPELTATERRIELNGVPLKLSRLECADWDGPLLSFDMQEPLQKGLERSQIRNLDALFKQKCPGYNLVDYGPLDVDELEID